MTEKNEILDTLGEKVKALESVSAKVMLDENLPICVRLDGKAFHTFTKGLKRPFDERLSKAMIDTMNFVMEISKAKIAYTQSDEITLVYFKTKPKEQFDFSAKVQKLTSILASQATAKFNLEKMLHIPEKKDTLAFFDCRIWNVPSLDEVVDLLVWRQEDAIKNAVSMAAHAEFGHKKILNKSSREKIEMLKSVGIEWKDYPEFFKSGTYAIKKLEEIPLPENLKDFSNNQGKETYVRSSIQNIHLPRLKHLNNKFDILIKPILDQVQASKDIKNKMKI